MARFGWWRLLARPSATTFESGAEALAVQTLARLLTPQNLAQRLDCVRLTAAFAHRAEIRAICDWARVVAPDLAVRILIPLAKRKVALALSPDSFRRRITPNNPE